jgi:hypothetical protein
MLNETDKRCALVFAYAISIFTCLFRFTVAGDTLSENVKPPPGLTLLTVNVVVAVFVFPAASVAVIVIVCVPVPTTVPASGLCVTVTGPQLSLAVVPATTLGIVARPLLSAFTLVGAGADSVGAVLSMTVTVCVAGVEFPAPSVAV